MNGSSVGHRRRQRNNWRKNRITATQPASIFDRQSAHAVAGFFDYDNGAFGESRAGFQEHAEQSRRHVVRSLAGQAIQMTLTVRVLQREIIGVRTGLLRHSTHQSSIGSLHTQCRAFPTTTTAPSTKETGSDTDFLRTASGWSVRVKLDRGCGRVGLITYLQPKVHFDGSEEDDGPDSHQCRGHGTGHYGVR